MTSSEKLADLDSKHWQALRTYLIEKQASGVLTIRLPDLIRATGIDRGKAIAAVTALSEEGKLRAKIQIRCPECDAHEATYSRKSAVPDESITCFSCGHTYSSSERGSWEVVYSISGEVDVDFFRDLKVRLKTFVESGHDLPPSYFKQEFERLDNMEEITDESERGRLFDYFVGLLFVQVDGLEVIVKESIPKGEIDVFIECGEAPDWIYRILGNVALVENKWEAGRIGQSEVNNFHDKAEDISLRTRSNLGYFISINGFTTDAENEINNRTAPNIIAFDRGDIEEMVEKGSAKEKIRNNVI